MSQPPAPQIVDIKGNALDDGPGIRTVVFLKGCPLRCAWCQNPEAISPLAEVLRDPARCRRCGRCTEVCAAGRARPSGEREEGACRSCGACLRACPAAARRPAGRRYSPEELRAKLLRDEPFWRHSGGGVTFSGGEPALFSVYLGAVAAPLAARGVHLLLETAGHFDLEEVSRELLPHLSAVYFDLKIVDDELHRRHTGRSNQRILENLRQLAGRPGLELLPRLPLVPGITDTEENLDGIVAVLRELGLPRLAILPYNPLWISKRRGLGLELGYTRESWMSAEEVGRIRARLAAAGLQVLG